MSLLVNFALALLLTAALLPLCVRYAATLGLMDSATQRKVHTGLVPRSGGIAIVLGVSTALLVWMPVDQRHVWLFAAVAVIVLFGYLDDRLDLNARWKLYGQLAAALVFLIGCGGFTWLPLLGIDPAPVVLTIPVTLLFLVGVTNAVNLSDGLDGLAAGNSLLSLVLLAVLAAQTAEYANLILALAVMGGLLGFLRFNTHPAAVFMGDTGSQFLGFTAASLTVLVFQSEELAISPALPLLIFGLPILDTCSVIAIRYLRGRPVMRADRSHLHHQLLKLGLLHYEVVIIMYVLQAIAVGLAWILRCESDLLVLGAYAGYCSVVIGTIAWVRLSGWQAHVRAGARERRNRLIRRLIWYHEHSHRVIAVALGAFVVLNAATLGQPPAGSATTAMLTTAILVSFWVVFRHRQELVTRVLFYSATMFLAYSLLMQNGGAAPLGAPVDVFLVVLTVALLLAMRMTRRDRFRLDSEDYLVLLVVVVVPLLPITQFDQMALVRAALVVTVLLYGCEFVLASGGRSPILMNMAGLGSLLVAA